MPGTREGMYAARGPARPQAGHGAAHNRTSTPSHGVTLLRHPGLSARGHPRQGRCGAGQAGRAEARSLTRASRAHEQAAARKRDTRGQLTMPCKPLCGRETAGRTPLDTDPLLQGCTFTRHLPCARFPTVTITLETGGADTYSRRAIPGSEPSQSLCAPGSRCSDPLVVIKPGGLVVWKRVLDISKRVRKGAE